MSAPDSILAKLRAIKALAESGVDGERANARRMLAELSERHGIPLADLDIQERTLVRFRYRGPHEYRLLRQLVCHLLDRMDVTCYIPVDKPRGTLGFDLTPAEAFDLRSAWKHYRAAWRQHMEDSLIVFINVNGIFPETASAEHAAAAAAGERQPRTSPSEAARLTRLAMGTSPAPWTRPSTVLPAPPEEPPPIPPTRSIPAPPASTQPELF